MPPHELLRRILVAHGYDAAPVSALQTNQLYYHAKPTPQQIGAYDMEIVKAVRSSALDRLKELRRHKGSESMNACNRFGESVSSCCGGRS